jgi:hypothetical protein
VHRGERVGLLDRPRWKATTCETGRLDPTHRRSLPDGRERRPQAHGARLSERLATVEPGRRTSRCSGSAVTTSTLARLARSTASPTSSRKHTSSTVDASRAASLDEIEGFAEDVARAGGVPVRPPECARFEAFVRGEPLNALDIPRWQDARQPIADAMAAAVAPWLPYITTFDLTSEDAMAAVENEPLVREGRNAFEAWLARAGRDSA